VRRLIHRTAALALCVTVAVGAAAVPCAAAETPATKAKGKLTQLSPASRQVLGTITEPASPKLRIGGGGKLRSSEGGRQQQPAATPATSGSFFKSTRGKITLALMAGGVGFTIWSINHDRKPVKSPIR
jgi:hypothetical protein